MGPFGLNAETRRQRVCAVRWLVEPGVSRSFFLQKHSINDCLSGKLEVEIGFEKLRRTYGRIGGKSIPRISKGFSLTGLASGSRSLRGGGLRGAPFPRLLGSRSRGLCAHA